MSTLAPASISRGSLWTGRIISALLVLFLIFGGAGKAVKAQPVVEATVRLGFPETTIVPIGITLLAATALYVIPPTSVLGAVLLTGYLGGATAANVRLGGPAFNVSFPIIFGVLVWLGLFLRESRLRALLPWRALPR
jgi:hypothetical protein